MAFLARHFCVLRAVEDSSQLLRFAPDFFGCFLVYPLMWSDVTFEVSLGAGVRLGDYELA